MTRLPTADGIVEIEADAADDITGKAALEAAQ
jgi:hypothetical protein